jgi:predicted DsbA family dithiol-disulfide isomerase
MKVEIWSDIACPFCYIGKRRFENALEKFSKKGTSVRPPTEVEIVWKSYQLDPYFKPVLGQNIHQMLAEKKGWTEEHARQLNQQVVTMAQEEGLNYNLDSIIPANTLNAHRLIHLAAKHGLQDEAKERLLSAYFTEGRNLNSKEALGELAVEIGLSFDEVETLLNGKEFADEVNSDAHEGAALGVRGVPFFVFDRKYAISGAQPEHLFLETMEKVVEGK